MSEERKWCVYCHTNKINGKVYIGITSRDVNIRWKNGKGYQQGTYFRNAIDKYGFDNFFHEILYVDLPEYEAKLKEKELIKFYKQSQVGCYNLTDGGDGVLGVKFSQETLKRMSIQRKGLTPNWCKDGMPKNIREKISNSKKGIAFTEEHRENLSNAHKGKKLSLNTRKQISNNSPIKKEVICLETLEIFNSISQANKKYPNCGNHIGEVCLGKRLQCGGLTWMYYEDYIKEKGGLAIEI